MAGIKLDDTQAGFVAAWRGRDLELRMWAKLAGVPWRALVVRAIDADLWGVVTHRQEEIARLSTTSQIQVNPDFVSRWRDPTNSLEQIADHFNRSPEAIRRFGVSSCGLAQRGRMVKEHQKGIADAGGPVPVTHAALIEQAIEDVNKAEDYDAAIRASRGYHRAVERAAERFGKSPSAVRARVQLLRVRMPVLERQAVQNG
ncbi:MAG: hypothetical protein HWE26_13765 [Alteromonadaceae bacterium]|nr:hypothetical protein [Alteromonadaceae bacterium]